MTETDPTRPGPSQPPPPLESMAMSQPQPMLPSQQNIWSNHPSSQPPQAAPYEQGFMPPHDPNMGGAYTAYEAPPRGPYTITVPPLIPGEAHAEYLRELAELTNGELGLPQAAQVDPPPAEAAPPSLPPPPPQPEESTISNLLFADDSKSSLSPADVTPLPAAAAVELPASVEPTTSEIPEDTPAEVASAVENELGLKSEPPREELDQQMQPPQPHPPLQPSGQVGDVSSEATAAAVAAPVTALPAPQAPPQPAAPITRVRRKRRTFLDAMKLYVDTLQPVDCVIMVERCRPFSKDTCFMKSFKAQYLSKILRYVHESLYFIPYTVQL